MVITGNKKDNKGPSKDMAGNTEELQSYQPMFPTKNRERIREHQIPA